MPRKPDRIYDPYCYFKLDIGVENAYLPLNRKYKPIGVAAEDWIDYNEYARKYQAFVILNLKFVERVFPQQLETSNLLQTYGDGPSSWRDAFIIRDKVNAEQERLAERQWKLR